MKEYESVILHLLNLKEKNIESFISSDQKIIITLKSDEKKCPFCTSDHIKSNGYYHRKVSVTSDILEEYDISLKVPRKLCLECHSSFSDFGKIAPRKSKVSYKSIIKFMKLLENPSMTFREAARLTSISITTAVRIFDRHVHIRRSSLPEAICVDEVYTCNTDYKDGKFSFVIYDFDRQCIIDVVPSRKKYELYKYFEGIDEKERNNVRYISMDMYHVYRMVAHKYFKKAIVCVDNFHILKHLNDDLSRIRIRIMNSFDTSSNEYYLLKHFNYLLLDRTIDLDNEPKYNRRFDKYLNLRDLLNMILSIDNDLYEGFKLKELYYSFSKDMQQKDKEQVLADLTDMFISSEIHEFDEFISILKNWKKEIINSFSVFNGKRINNSIAESMNVKISTLLFNTRGIRNHERRRKRIMYSVNKDGFLLK